jgi:hypothetical protein
VLKELQDKKPQKTQRKQRQPKRLRNRQYTENNKLCRSKQHLIIKHNNQFIIVIKKDNVLIVFITCKEQVNIELAIKLQKDGVIITLKDLFKRS